MFPEKYREEAREIFKILKACTGTESEEEAAFRAGVLIDEDEFLATSDLEKYRLAPAVVIVRGKDGSYRVMVKTEDDSWQGIRN